jgi:hypothetical protein
MMMIEVSPAYQSVPHGETDPDLTRLATSYDPDLMPALGDDPGSPEGDFVHLHGFRRRR